MRGPVKDVFAWLTAVPHPPRAALVASTDGELGPGRKTKIKAHLQACGICCARVDLLQEGLRSFERSLASMRTGFSIESGLQELMSTIHDRAKDGLAGPEAEQSPVYASLLSELSIYLGPRAAMQLLQRCTYSLSLRDGLQETIAPVIIGLLGQHTGSAVLANVFRIWDQSQEVAS